MGYLKISLTGARRLTATLLVGMLATHAHAQDGDYVDPPGRIAYLSDSAGQISFSPAGEADWLDFHRNRPLIPGDRLWIDRDARAELQVGTAFLRLGGETAFEILALDDDFAQVELTEGVLHLTVRRLLRGQAYEIATPNLALVVDRVGRYRVEVDPDRDETSLVVWAGAAEAWGEAGSFSLREGEAVIFRGRDLRDHRIYGLPREDAFDLYARERDRLIDRSPTLRYVDDELAGYASLDTYGAWRNAADHGPVWFPHRVDADWAPYRDGHWVFQSPWGWTWVDNAPWGFAPSHYGRWVNVSNRWGWVPGPRQVRPVYAPALVVFVGGDRWQVAVSHRDSSPIGWFPLGPRDVFVPSYRVSRNYFSRVNVHNTVINTTLINTIYVDYSRGGDYGRRFEYAHRGRSSAFTAVPREAFIGARDVRRAQIRIERNSLANAEFSGTVDYAPNRRARLGGAPEARSVPQRGVFDRGVIARTRPAPAVRAFDAGAAQPRQDARGSGLPTTTARDQPARQNVRVIETPRRAVDVRSASPQKGPETAGRALPDRANRGREPGAAREGAVRSGVPAAGEPAQRRREAQDPRREVAPQQPTRGTPVAADRQRQANQQRDAETRQREADARERGEREPQQADSQRQQRMAEEGAARQRDAAARERNQQDQVQREQTQREQLRRQGEADARQRQAEQQSANRERETESRARAQREQADAQRERQGRAQADAEARQRESAARQEAQREREAGERQRQSAQQAEARQRDAETRQRTQAEQQEIQRQRLEKTRAEAEARNKANAERRKREEDEREGRGD